MERNKLFGRGTAAGFRHIFYTMFHPVNGLSLIHI